MPSTAATLEAAPNVSKGLNIGLWTVQVLLAVGFGMAGGMKLVVPIADLLKQMDWVASAPWLPRFIGVAELAGALGLVLPSLTRIKPILTPIAAVGLATIMVLALGFHVSRGEMSHLPPVIVLGALAVFVAWGRFTKARIAPRA
jgi:putative oxidoreductase